MKSSVHLPIVLLAFTACIVLFEAHLGESTFVPTRCLCPASYKAVRGPFTDLTVVSKGSHCEKHEIIVKLKRNNREVCISPEGQQGKRLLRCWNRMKRNGGNKKKCLRTRERKKPQQKRTKQMS
ncbi:hypothetical protein GJAV_G00242960 [Gymnothorax javanicus]|nr:hypothetical protein GJAV_G00242960 [Gymnothorax javanicus]